MKYFLQLPCLLGILFSMQLKAQQPDTLSLKQAWDQAYKTYPALAGQQALIGEYQMRKQEVQSHSLPQLQFQLQNSFGTFAGSTGAFFPVPGVFNVTGNAVPNGTQPKTAANTFGSVLMDWKVFEFGKQHNAIKGANYQVEAAKSSYNATQISLQVKVSRLYFDVMYSNANLDWTDRNLNRVKEILELTKSLTQAGLKPGADTLLASSSYAQAKAYQNEWRGKYNASRVNFTEVVPQNNFVIPHQYFMSSKNLEVIADTISADHPYLQVLNNQVLYEQTQKDIAARKALPSLSILGGLSSRGTGINVDGTIESGIASGYRNYANNYLVGVGLSWNISGAFTSSLEKKRVEKTIQVQQAKYEQQKLQMNTSLNAVTTRIVQQKQQIEQSHIAVNTAKEAYTLYLSRYESGLINLTELLQIQSILQKAEKEAIEAQEVLWDLLITQSEISGDFNILSNQFNQKP
ncbi:MAG: TolC family protein [Candidatus Pedobacter colombiensis]|uniref:TolC family protein n=1 Tax=Candidatus Pedobacter colombiensis TaxID=3121371 RepID=A0AAJ5W5X7_9SPHI|nr:TolC family protein [Pedobacter sp.]WEK17740.1 MAG: TolC family protein [Pedobacter sp.]